MFPLRQYPAGEGSDPTLTANLMATPEPYFEHNHIESTAVPGCAAKPVIDIMGMAVSLTAYQPDQTALTADLGYEALGDYGVPGSDFLFRYGEDNFHMGVFESGDENICNNLKIRGHLAGDESLRTRHVALKRAAAVAHLDEYTAYNGMKAALTAEIPAR